MRQAFSTALIERNALFRAGLALILRAARFRILSSAAEIDDSYIDSLARYEPELLVMGSDVDPCGTARQIRLFKQKYSTGRVAVVARRYDRGDVLSAFRAGADAYFVNMANCQAFTKSLELVMLGQTFVPAEILPLSLGTDDETIARAPKADAELLQMATREVAPHMSEQEKRILRHLIGGDSNKIIARKLEIMESTVKVHVKAILRKIRVHNRTQAAVWAMNTNSLDSILSDLNSKSKNAGAPGQVSGPLFAPPRNGIVLPEMEKKAIQKIA